MLKRPSCSLEYQGGRCEDLESGDDCCASASAPLWKLIKAAPTMALCVGLAPGIFCFFVIALCSVRTSAVCKHRVRSSIQFIAEEVAQYRNRDNHKTSLTQPLPQIWSRSNDRYVLNLIFFFFFFLKSFIRTNISFIFFKLLFN